MKPEPNRNLPASVRQRLLTLSERRKEPFDLVLVRYGVAPRAPMDAGNDQGAAPLAGRKLSNRPKLRLFRQSLRAVR